MQSSQLYVISILIFFSANSYAEDYFILGFKAIREGNSYEATKYFRKEVEYRLANYQRSTLFARRYHGLMLFRSYSILGKSLVARNVFVEGKGYLNKALKLSKSLSLKSGPNTSQIYTALGRANVEQGNIKLGIDFYQKALKILVEDKMVYSVKKGDLGLIYYGLSVAYERLGNSAKVVAYARKAVPMLRQHYGTRHILTIRAVSRAKQRKAPF